MVRPYGRLVTGWFLFGQPVAVIIWLSRKKCLVTSLLPCWQNEKLVFAPTKGLYDLNSEAKVKRQFEHLKVAKLSGLSGAPKGHESVAPGFTLGGLL